MNHTEVGHFNYIGDSIIGSYVNLGAGSRLANLEFRSPADKRDMLFPRILMEVDDARKSTPGVPSLARCWAIMPKSDATLYCPRPCLLGKESCIYPNVTVPKGYYPPLTRLIPAVRKIKPRKIITVELFPSPLRL